MPLNAKYRYNAQAAIWRTKDLYDCFMEQESAWEWELLGNKRNRKIFAKKEIYVLKYGIKSPYDYNFIQYNKSNKDKIIVISPVMRGKWCKEVIDDCFKANGIAVDYSVRGLYVPEHISFLKRVIRKLKKILSKEYKARYKLLVTEPIKEYKKHKK